MKHVINMFFGTENTKPWLVLFCLVLASVAEAAGITTLLPAAAAALDAGEGSTSLIGQFIKQTVTGLGITPNLGNLLLIIIGLLFFKAVLTFGALSYAGVTGAFVTVNFRRRLINALFEARWSYYADQSSGNMANAISNDAARAGDAYAQAATTLSLAFQVFAYALASIIIDWQVAIVGIIAGGMLFFITNTLVTRTKRLGYRISELQATFTTDAIDMLNNVKPLKTMNRYGAMVANLSGQLKKMRRVLMKLHINRQAMTSGGDFLVAAVVGLGAYALNSYWNKSLPEMMVTGLIFYQIVSSLARLQRQRNIGIQIESAFVRTLDLINEVEANREIMQGTATPDIGAGCSFHKVSFAHGSKPTVSDLSFVIPANQTTILQGPSGAGKTTIIDLLIGLNIPQSGEIRVGADRLADIDIKAWRGQFGYVPQELLLFHDSVRANISLADDTITESDIWAAIEKAGAREFIASLPDGIDTNVGEMGGKLSGGQRQRISLARALVKNPKILILDEVTSALDPATEKEIVSNILALKGAYTVIAITHRPAWTDIADRLYVVDDGRISEVKRKKRS